MILKRTMPRRVLYTAIRIHASAGALLFLRTLASCVEVLCRATKGGWAQRGFSARLIQRLLANCPWIFFLLFCFKYLLVSSKHESWSRGVPELSQVWRCLNASCCANGISSVLDYIRYNALWSKSCGCITSCAFCDYLVSPRIYLFFWIL